MSESSKWFMSCYAKDPADESKFPRFQVWGDYDWIDFVETVNDTLRDQCVGEGSMEIVRAGEAQVDLGTCTGQEFNYVVHVTPDGHAHESVQEAIDNVKKHKRWLEEFVEQCVGWQTKVGEQTAKTRPVRIVVGAIAEPADPAAASGLGGDL